jgi:hypothetical protein
VVRFSPAGFRGLAGFGVFFSGGISRFGAWVGEHLEKKQVFSFQISVFRFSVEEAWGVEAADHWTSVARFFSMRGGEQSFH